MKYIYERKHLGNHTSMNWNC